MKKKDNYYNSNMCPSLSKINSNIGSITFFAKSHPGDVCGSNGLPLTPNSIAILGRAQRLKAIKHQNLCEYLDFIRGKHERTIIVSEYTGIPLEGKYKGFTIDRILKILYQIADGLNEIHNHGIVTHNLDPTTILLDDNDNVKLFNYGLFYMTNYGEYVSFPIGNVKYMPPERLLGSKNNIKSDIWSLGIVIAELLLECEFWSTLKLSNIIRRILSLNNTQNVFEKIAREHNCYDKYQNLNSNIKQLIEKCLLVNVKNRLIPSDILNSELFINENNDLDNKTITNIDNDDQNKIKALSLSSSSSTSSSSSLLLLSSLQQVSKKTTTPLTTNELLLRCPLQQIYYLWQLAGGDVQTELKKEGLIRSEAPILSVPRIVCLNGQIIGPKRSQSYLVDNRVVMLRLNNLRERLKTIPYTAYFPLIHSPKISFKYTNHGMDQLPLIIRERDTEYQFHRTMLFYRLLKGYPFTRDLIVQEAEIDIPPLLRGQVWACLLDVIPNGMYDKIDKVTPTSTDRQIEVDIPRCHQYDELLSSPEGHRKLKRLLKAWVTSHPEYVYWQGLDSLTAPFLYLNFNDEELAFLSVYKFIPKYLHWFFLKDNSAIIKEYLCKFSQLTAFHEPLLAKHLNGINFIPELFAIPWFLTMFSHVFPLHKIIHLWDRLMLGDNSFPLFIGISVLKQLKNTLLSSGFNECILLFSDLPDIVMDTCVIDSQKMYSMTPKSISYRQHVVHIIEPGEFDINDITLNELQSELCPRISANDLIDLLYNEPDRVAIIDIRGIQEYTRSHVIRSINVPFTTVLLGDTRLESLNVPNLDEQLNGRIVVILSTVHENAKLFSKFLVDCGVCHVCILHKGFDILHSVVPNILVSS